MLASACVPLMAPQVHLVIFVVFMTWMCVLPIYSLFKSLAF